MEIFIEILVGGSSLCFFEKGWWEFLGEFSRGRGFNLKKFKEISIDLERSFWYNLSKIIRWLWAIMVFFLILGIR